MADLGGLKNWQLSHTVWQSATSDVVLVRNEVTGHIQLSNDFIPFLKQQPDGSLRSRTDKIPAGGNITHATEIAYRAPNRPLFPRQPDIEKLVEDFKGQLVERRQRGSTVLPPLTPPLEELPEIVRYALQYPRKLLNGPQKAPDCYGCGCRAVRKKTKTNINGNRGRWFYVCANTMCPLLDTDDTFLVFDDKRGNNSTNPFCGCGKPSKLALGRWRFKKGEGMRGLVLVCRLGACGTKDTCAGWLKEEYVEWAKEQMIV